MDYHHKRWKKHEKYVMKKEGLKPVPMSGASWLAKEDGESEFFLVQLKSTEKGSISVKITDVLTLIKNAILARKIPIFMLDFIGSQLLYCLRKDDIIKVAAILEKEQ